MRAKMMAASILAAALAASPLFCEDAARDQAARAEFAAIDAAVRAFPKAKSVQAVAASIEKAAASEKERARAVYIWVTENIRYDADAFFRGAATKTDPEGVFKSGKSVCQGYAGLVGELCGKLGLEAAVISGWAKGYGYKAGDRVSGTNHAWNAIKVDGRWLLVDSTWGAGYVDGAKFVKRFSDFWYDTPPELFVYWHLPEAAAWQLLPKPVSATAYEKAAYVSHQSVEALYLMGFPTATLLAAVASGGVAESYSYPGIELSIEGVPATAAIEAGVPLTIRIVCDDLDKLLLVNGKTWSDCAVLERDGKVFTVTFTPKKGTLYVAGEFSFDGEKAYWPFILYIVK